MPLPGRLQDVTFKRPAFTADAMGGQVRTNSTIYSVSGSLQPASGRIIEEFARRSMQISHTFYTNTEIVLKAGDIMTDASAATYNVVYFTDEAGQARVFSAHLLKKD